MTTASAPTSVTLRLPEGWCELDPRAEDIVAELRRAIGPKQLEGLDEDTLLRLLAPLGLEIRRLSGQADFVLIGIYANAIPVGATEPPLVITAQTMLALSHAGDDLDAVHLGLSADPQAHPATRLSIVTLPAGEAVAQVGPITVHHPDWDSPVPAHQRRYFVRVPGTEAMAVLTFLTPNLDLAEPFDAVFEAIAGTLRFS